VAWRVGEGVLKAEWRVMGRKTPVRSNTVPIGTVRRDESRRTLKKVNQGQKRSERILELWEPGDGDDDEEAAYLLTAPEEATRANGKGAEKITAASTVRNRDELGGGVAAALGKLRNES
jgi:hypothetical protein